MALTDQLLSPAQLASYLGLSTQTIYNRRYQGLDLPRSIMVGGQVRYRESDVLAWLDSHADERQPA